MGFSFRKSFRIAPGLRMNLSRRGVGFSAGVKGLRLGVGPRGTQFSAGRGGFYYRKMLGAGRRAEQGGADGSGAVEHSLLMRLLVWIVKAVVILAVLLIVIAAIAGVTIWYVRR